MSATERQERVEHGSAPVDDTSLGDGARRQRCAYCENDAVPGLRHHTDWPVCAEHETPLCAATLTINQTGEADRVMRCAKPFLHDGRHHDGEWGYDWEATDD